LLRCRLSCQRGAFTFHVGAHGATSPIGRTWLALAAGGRQARVVYYYVLLGKRHPPRLCEQRLRLLDVIWARPLSHECASPP